MIGALCAAAAVLLLWSGLAKVVRPDATAAMLAALLRRPSASRRTAARLVGVGEVVVGAAALVTGGRPACAALAACYLVFTTLAARLARGPRPASCGCFGRADTPASRIHVAVDAVACAAGAAGTAAPPGGWGGFAGEPPLLAVVGLGQAVLLAAMAYLLLTALPAVLAERDRAVSTT